MCDAFRAVMAKPICPLLHWGCEPTFLQFADVAVVNNFIMVPVCPCNRDRSVKGAMWLEPEHPPHLTVAVLNRGKADPTASAGHMTWLVDTVDGGQLPVQINTMRFGPEVF